MRKHRYDYELISNKATRFDFKAGGLFLGYSLLQASAENANSSNPIPGLLCETFGAFTARPADNIFNYHHCLNIDIVP